MSAHPVLAAHPRWQEHEARVADLRVRQESVRQQVLAAQAALSEQQRAYDGDLAEAVRTGGTLPDKPPPMPDTFDRALEMLRHEDEALRAAGGALMAEIAPELEESTRDRNRVAMVQVAKTGKALEKLRNEVQCNLSFVAGVRAQVDGANPGGIVRPSRAARTRTRLTYDELLSFAEFDSDPLEPEPLPPPVGRILVDDGSDEVVMRRHNAQFTDQQRVKMLGLQVQKDEIGAFGARPWVPLRDMPRPGEI